MIRWPLRGTLAAAAVIGAAALASGSGLSTPFIDVEVPAVPLASPLTVHDQSGHGLRLRNLGDTPVRVVVTPLVPTPEQLREGAAAIPEVGWVTLSPNELTIPPGADGEFAVTLRVPEEKEYRHRQFQVMLWSRTVPDRARGVTVNAGLLSRIRFHTEN